MSAQTPEQVHQLFAETLNAGDIDGLMALYEPEAVLVVQPGMTVTGTDQLREALGGFIALNGTISMTSLGAVTGTDIAFLADRWSLEGTGPDGQPVTLGGVTADVVRRGDDGVWRFVLDNPFGDAIFNAG